MPVVSHIFFRAVSIIAALVYSLATSAQQAALTEAELRSTIEASYEAYASRDVDEILKYQFGFEPGFGFRTQQPRGDTDIETNRQILTVFNNAAEYYRIFLEELNISVEGNVGVAWGFHVEEFQIRGLPPERVLVRFTQTYIKRDDGTLVSILAHRDIQPFSEAGQYIPDYLEQQN